MIIDKFDGFYTFSVEQKSFIFDIFNMECAEIEDHVLEALNRRNIDDLDEEIKEMLQRLAELHLFFYDTKELEFIVPDKIDCVYFSLAPVTNCNLECKYCFADSGNNFKGLEKEFQSKRIYDIVTFLLHNFPDTKQFRLDFVSGGEPLLHPNKLFEILNIFNDELRKKEKLIKFWLCTNATCITEDILKKLDQYKVQIGISIDGPIEINDNCRIYKSGKGTYQDIIKSINIIQNSHHISNYLKYIWGLSVITSKSKGIVPIIEHHKSLGLKNIQMKFVRLDKSDELAITEMQLPMIFKWIDELLEYFYNLIYTGDIDTPMMFLNENDHLGKILRRLILKQSFTYRCHAARDKFSFVPNGDVYPCDSFVGINKYRIGNIYEGISKEIPTLFSKMSVMQRNICNSCWARFVCGGDCFHNAYCVNADMSLPDPIFCKIVKHMIQKSLSTLNSIRSQKIKTLDRLEHLLKIRSQT